MDAVRLVVDELDLYESLSELVEDNEIVAELVEALGSRTVNAMATMPFNTITSLLLGRDVHSMSMLDDSDVASLDSISVWKN